MFHLATTGRHECLLGAHSRAYAFVSPCVSSSLNLPLLRMWVCRGKLLSRWGKLRSALRLVGLRCNIRSRPKSSSGYDQPTVVLSLYLVDTYCVQYRRPSLCHWRSSLAGRERSCFGWEVKYAYWWDASVVCVLLALGALSCLCFR